MASNDTVLIGAGLGGLTLALALHARGISSTVYELREESYQHGGAIMLSPNALRVLDCLGVWDRMQNNGYTFETLTFLNDEHEVLGRYCFGNRKLYGYPGFRIYRTVLLEILRRIAKERGIPIHYERKFSHVIEETDSGVKFAFADGTEQITSRLLGTDGTHSKVREWIVPNATPTFSGALGVTGHLAFSKIRHPFPNYPFPASISGKHGAYVLAPQDVKGTDIFEGRQFFVEDSGRQGWDNLVDNKQELYRLLTENKGDWPDIVQSAMEATDPQDLTIWPFHTLPKLDSWYSPKGRVIIMGDAAHAIPPTAGQGANQAFEDAWTLAWLLYKGQKHANPAPQILKLWYDYRQARIAKVMELNRKMGNMRLPLAEQAQLQADDRDFGSAENMRWLFKPKLEKDMKKAFWEGGKKAFHEKFSNSWGPFNG